MLNFDPVTVVITLINLALLFFILRAILFKRVSAFIAARGAKIRDDLEKAAQTREDAAALLAAYQEKLKSAEAQAQAILRSARETAEKRATLIAEQGEAQAASQLKAARKQIAAEREAAVCAFRADAVRLVLTATAKLLQREITGKDAERLAEQALREQSAPDARRRF
ncbi:MAG: ATP synthase F0 subunit B [Spirochaetaceae bacterium]|jgi:F-type H+-transporting ATPase subunit b|nr:ATP synthase F0 subunit B [Spirochaetaceae bacterium]